VGCLNHLVVGYSREPGHPKQYVQDAIKSSSKLLKDLLAHPNSHIYVCGDSNMANAVSASFAAVIGGHPCTAHSQLTSQNVGYLYTSL